MRMLAAFVFKGEAFIIGEDGRMWRITYDHQQMLMVEFIEHMPERKFP